MSVEIEVCGGLGNQLFQVAALFAYAKENSLKMTIVKNKESPSVTPRITYWDTFLQKFSKLTEDQKLDKYNEYKEQACHYNKITTFESGSNVKLSGYFQSEKYFVDHRKDLLDLLVPSNDDIAYLEEKYCDLLKTRDNVGVIHIRRGDYLHLSYCHYVQTLDYYQRAMDLLKSKKNVTKWVVFTDDPEWAKGQEIFKTDTVFITNEKDYLELYLMSYFSNFIIANSSFSWWGSWLSKSTDKIVIAPKTWFAYAGPQDWYDIYPKDSIVI